MKKPVVLLVEDDSDLRGILQIFLEEEGLSVVGAANGRQALDALELVSPDVIITDLMMPELDGLALLDELHRRGMSELPVIAMSAFTPYLEQASSLGAEVRQKPFDAEELTSLAFQLATGGRPGSGAAEQPPFEDEGARLRAVLDLTLTEPATRETLQRLLDELRVIFRVPFAGISLVDDQCQRFAVHSGDSRIPIRSDRTDSFCLYAVTARAALVVQDAFENRFFSHNARLREFGLRFYAGVPLLAARGEAVGTLCIIDTQARSFSHQDLELLGLCARRVLGVIDDRDRRAHPKSPRSAYTYLDDLDEELGIYGRGLFTDILPVVMSRDGHSHGPMSLVVAALVDDRLPAVVKALRDAGVGELLGRLASRRIGALIPSRCADLVERLLLDAGGEETLTARVELKRYTGASTTALRQVEGWLGDRGLD